MLLSPLLLAMSLGILARASQRFLFKYYEPENLVSASLRLQSAFELSQFSWLPWPVLSSGSLCVQTGSTARDEWVCFSLF